MLCVSTQAQCAGTSEFENAAPTLMRNAFSLLKLGKEKDDRSTSAECLQRSHSPVINLSMASGRSKLWCMSSLV